MASQLQRVAEIGSGQQIMETVRKKKETVPFMALRTPGDFLGSINLTKFHKDGKLHCCQRPQKTEL